MNTYQIKILTTTFLTVFPYWGVSVVFVPWRPLYFLLFPLLFLFWIYIYPTQLKNNMQLLQVSAATANEEISRHKWLLSVDFVLSLIFLIHTAIFKCKAQLDMYKENSHRTHAANWVVFSYAWKCIICEVTLQIYFYLLLISNKFYQ